MWCHEGAHPKGVNSLEHAVFHHLNTTARGGEGLAFSARQHEDNDAGVYREIGSKTANVDMFGLGATQYALGYWVPKGGFTGASLFFFEKLDIGWPLTGHKGVSAYWNSKESHSTIATEPVDPDDSSNDILGVSLEVGARIQGRAVTP
eukprot:1181194-Prorocentrum_minimum.AAC.2